MKLLEPRRRLFYGLIASAQRDGGVLVIEDVVVPHLEASEGGEEAKALAAGYRLPLLLGGHIGDATSTGHVVQERGGVERRDFLETWLIS
jgi:D-lactate dehydrogenase (cytochrome)/glycolate oxidase